MELFIVFLICLFLIILFIPSTPEENNLNKFKRLTHCDIHEWESKPNNVDNNTYTVCKKCKFLPDSQNYES